MNFKLEKEFMGSEYWQNELIKIQKESETINHTLKNTRLSISKAEINHLLDILEINCELISHIKDILTKIDIYSSNSEPVKLKLISGGKK